MSEYNRPVAVNTSNQLPPHVLTAMIATPALTKFRSDLIAEVYENRDVKTSALDTRLTAVEAVSGLNAKNIDVFNTLLSKYTIIQNGGELPKDGWYFTLGYEPPEDNTVYEPIMTNYLNRVILHSPDIFLPLDDNNKAIKPRILGKYSDLNYPVSTDVQYGLPQIGAGNFSARFKGSPNSVINVTSSKGKLIKDAAGNGMTWGIPQLTLECVFKVNLYKTLQSPIMSLGNNIYIAVKNTGLSAEMSGINVAKAASLGSDKHHVVMVFDSGTLLLYLDGEFAGRATSTTVLSVRTDAALAVGNLPGGYGDNSFNGDIAGAAMYLKALTPEQIKDHYLALGL